MAGSIETVLFDLDGTLIHVDLDFPRMKQRVLDLASAHGIRDDRMEQLDILGVVEASAAALERREDTILAMQIRKRAATLLSEIEVAAAGSATAAPDAEDVIATLKARGIPTGIVTRNCRAAVEIALQRVHLPVGVVLTREDVPHPKPHPDHLRRALEALGSSADSALMVGDHWMDVQAGRAARTRTAGILTTGRDRSWFDPAPPDYVLHRLGELLEIV